MHPNRLKSDLKKIRIGLIILTIMQLTYITLIIVSFALIVKYSVLDMNIIWLWIFLIFAGAATLWIIQVIFTFIIMKYERKNMPVSNKKRYDNIVMIMFTGIIGLWLWLPNKDEVEQLIRTPTVNNEKGPTKLP